jgi:methyltransferase (TIGR00027 family)
LSADKSTVTNGTSVITQGAGSAASEKVDVSLGSTGTAITDTKNAIAAAVTELKDYATVPGRNNSIVARVRFFDDFVKKSIDEGIEQLVILGAGYDSRAYRIEGLKKIKTFEVDHPTTQNIKMEKIKMILGSLPGHVVYVPCNLETEDFGQRLIDMGYNRHIKTLFLMEGLLMYLQPKVVDEILSFIVQNSGKNSSILFDYFPQSAVDGSSKLEAGRNIRNQVSQLGEPFKFGIKEGTVETFLTRRGFTQACNVTIEDCKKAYFQGINKNRIVDSLKSFVHAVVQ